MADELVKHQGNQLTTKEQFNREQIELIKETICKGASDNELAFFMQIAKRTGLDPFARQIYSVGRWDSRAKREVHTTMISIDGLRLVAERSGKYTGQTEPQWCGEDGDWKTVWTKKEAPLASRVGVFRSDFKSPTYGVAYYSEYAQTKKDGSPTHMWASKPRLMLAKCAESLAFRKAFPQELSGIYTGEEMGAQLPSENPRQPHYGDTTMEAVDGGHEFVAHDGLIFDDVALLIEYTISAMDDAKTIDALSKIGASLKGIPLSKELKATARTAYIANEDRINEREALQDEEQDEVVQEIEN